MRLGTLLIVLGLIYSWASKPQSWRWLEDNAPGAADGQMALAEMGPSSGGPSTEGTPVAKPAVDETVVAAPTDGGEAFEGFTLRLFDPHTATWRIWWSLRLSSNRFSYNSAPAIRWTRSISWRVT